ncbi:MAG: RDD family protein [Alcanivoracaceae bacterium]|nr:RDD family protein [Alcanivoracaceae bacterium]
MSDPSADRQQDLFLADLPPAPLWRRLVAMIYDGLLLVAVWFITAGILVSIYPKTGLPMDDVSGVMVPSEAALHWLLFPLLLLVTWGFYAWFWTHGGQTLGMRAWKLLSRDIHRRQMTLLQTVSRFLSGIISTGLLGIGWLIALLPAKQTLHDSLSSTETVVVPKAR